MWGRCHKSWKLRVFQRDNSFLCTFSWKEIWVLSYFSYVNCVLSWCCSVVHSCTRLHFITRPRGLQTTSTFIYLPELPLYKSTFILLGFKCVHESKTRGLNGRCINKWYIVINSIKTKRKTVSVFKTQRDRWSWTFWLHYSSKIGKV